MASEPVIEWYSGEDPNGSQVTSTDYGTVDAGTESSITEFWVYNDRGGSTDTPTAEDVQYTTFDNSDGDETKDVVTEKWLEVRHDEDNGSAVSDSFEAVGGSADADKKSLPNIAGTEFHKISTKVVVLSSPDPGQVSFVQRVEYTFT